MNYLFHHDGNIIKCINWKYVSVIIHLRGGFFFFFSPPCAFVSVRACVCLHCSIAEKWNFHNQTETLFTKWELVFLKNKTQTKHKHTLSALERAEGRVRDVQGLQPLSPRVTHENILGSELLLNYLKGWFLLWFCRFVLTATGKHSNHNVALCSLERDVCFVERRWGVVRAMSLLILWHQSISLFSSPEFGTVNSNKTVLWGGRKWKVFLYPTYGNCGGAS